MAKDQKRVTIMIKPGSDVDTWLEKQNIRSQSIAMALSLVAKMYPDGDLVESMLDEMAKQTEESKAEDPIKAKSKDSNDFKAPKPAPKPSAPTPPNAGGGDDFGFLGY